MSGRVNRLTFGMGTGPTSEDGRRTIIQNIRNEYLAQNHQPTMQMMLSPKYDKYNRQPGK